MSMKSRAPYWLAFLVLVGSAYGALKLRQAWAPEEPGSIGSTATRLAVGQPVQEFALQDCTGEEFASSTLQDRVWLATVFFAECPGSCLMLNRRLQELHDDPALAGLHLISITCDPANDTPERLMAYSEQFAPDRDRWHFCTGALGDLQRTAKRILKLPYSDRNHADRAALIGADGKLRGYFVVTDPIQFAQLKLQVKAALDEVGQAEGGAEIEPAEG